jgi:hypothetical protein
MNRKSVEDIRRIRNIVGTDLDELIYNHQGSGMVVELLRVKVGSED